MAIGPTFYSQTQKLESPWYINVTARELLDFNFDLLLFGHLV